MVNAAQNPFRTSRVHGLGYLLNRISWDDLFRRLESLNYRAAIVGAHGHGKSTLLNALGERLEAQGVATLRLFLNDSQRRLEREVYERFTKDTVALFDGAEQLGWLSWHRFLRQARTLKGVIITCHRPGRFPTLYECSTSHALLDDLINELHPAISHTQRGMAYRLFDQHHGDLRKVFFALYNQHINSFLE